MNKLLSLKRLIASLLFTVVLFSLTACEKQRQDNLSDRMYEYGVAAYEIIEDYFSGRLTSEEAKDKLHNNYSLQDMYYSARKRENESYANYGTPEYQDYWVQSSTFKAYYAMKCKSDGTGTDADIREAQDKLKKALWK